MTNNNKINATSYSNNIIATMRLTDLNSSNFIKS